MSPSVVAPVSAPSAGLGRPILPASVSVGTNPTFDGTRPRRVEVHLHDVDIDLYGRRLDVELVAYLRPTLRFADVADLVAQSRRDVVSCRDALGV